jgi:hypothetical protein
VSVNAFWDFNDLLVTLPWIEADELEPGICRERKALPADSTSGVAVDDVNGFGAEHRLVSIEETAIIFKECDTLLGRADAAEHALVKICQRDEIIEHDRVLHAVTNV